MTQIQGSTAQCYSYSDGLSLPAQYPSPVRTQHTFHHQHSYLDWQYRHTTVTHNISRSVRWCKQTINIFSNICFSLSSKGYVPVWGVNRSYWKPNGNISIKPFSPSVSPCCLFKSGYNSCQTDQTEIIFASQKRAAVTGCWSNDSDTLIACIALATLR